TEDLFFVADGKGGHFFSKTLAEHRARTREWRKIERAFRKRERDARPAFLRKNDRPFRRRRRTDLRSQRA
ncbi:MAG: hypothetical protein AAFQ44_11220, partial [Pseudomonadota bacterium]